MVLIYAVPPTDKTPLYLDLILQIKTENHLLKYTYRMLLGVAILYGSVALQASKSCQNDIRAISPGPESRLPGDSGKIMYDDAIS